MQAPRRIQGPIWAAAVVLLLTAVVLAATAPAGPAALGPGPERTPIQLPAPIDDLDGDTYHDDNDVAHGDVLLALHVAERPEGRLLVGTQDDHWRFGEGRPLAWRRVVDVAPELRVDSRAWTDANLRTGHWVDGTAHDTIILNVRDDRQFVNVTLESWVDERSRIASQTLRIDLLAGNRSFDAGPYRGTVAPRVELNPNTADTIIERWAPRIHFDSEELFYPVSGRSLADFDGFVTEEAAIEPWQPTFNNGRDEYVLLLTDFDKDGAIGARDAHHRTSALERRLGPEPTVHARATISHDEVVVVQYWFLYHYNFVLDDAGREVPRLAHQGDREFIQLTFQDLAAALIGTPEHITFSQHYRGIQLPGREPPIDVYPARGSHASFPAPGDDRALRPALQGYHDRFDGQGETWTPGNYTIERLGHQDWLMDNLWSPTTRHSRELGTATKPLLRHHFSYPYLDPLHWEANIPERTWEDALRMYGGNT